MIERAAIVNAARAWVGVPYAHQGRGREGLDCVGLLVVVGREVGLLPADWDMRNYPRAMRPDVLLAQLNRWLEPAIDVWPGNVVVIAARPRVWHVGFATASQTIIHAWQPAGAVIEHGLGADWIYKRQAVYKLPGAH